MAELKKTKNKQAKKQTNKKTRESWPKLQQIKSQRDQ